MSYSFLDLDVGRWWLFSQAFWDTSLIHVVRLAMAAHSYIAPCAGIWGGRGGAPFKPAPQEATGLIPLFPSQLTIKALHICPEAGLGGPECCLRVSLMPLRLNIDQVKREGGMGIKEHHCPCWKMGERSSPRTKMTFLPPPPCGSMSRPAPLLTPLKKLPGVAAGIAGLLWWNWQASNQGWGCLRIVSPRSQPAGGRDNAPI